ncbi:outer membrane lipoprotein-sorting protein [Ruficoccus sp. ZRK36]|uniref:outer membrane lipoprotein-sorting protein n=1 Tax=Ruficoccus sp. ZRK36 TaxID=2866311 RepID=UPI001C72DD81|nr:outer membrane lipoprotein-sorting protein [Ruficoccus sp. ZRK36]QYY34852.1 outer membrane lipoprotein-sorting protein [Ruficoccus sp. ZRK36]
MCCLAGAAHAQAAKPGERGRAAQEVTPLTLEEGRAQLEAFQRQRLSGDYVFRFELVHYPRRGDKVSFEGYLWGTWNAEGPRNRIVIWNDDNSTAPAVDMIVQNGLNPKVWVAGKDGRAVEMPKGQMRDPLLKDIVYTPFDLLMPFVYWENFDYAGSERRSGRPSDTFIMLPPPGWEKNAPELKGVAISLDRNFRALNKIEELDKDGQPMRTFKVVSYKEVDDQYIVKTIDLVDERSRDKTRFVVLAAAVGVNLPASTFDPRAIGLGLPPVRGLPFKGI